METIVVSNPLAVEKRLRSFGWTRDNFNEVIERMVGAKRDCTAHHPLGAGGYYAWSEGTARLRDVGVTVDGWEANNDDHIPTIYCPALKIKIAVCNTDGGTGFLNRQPQNWNKKGASFDRAVGLNQEGLGNILSESLEASMKVIAMPGVLGGMQLWYLCVYSDSEETRAELSLPYECDSGFFKTFRERIILMGGGEDGGVRRREGGPDTGDTDFEIVVTRKQG